MTFQQEQRPIVVNPLSQMASLDRPPLHGKPAEGVGLRANRNLQFFDTPVLNRPHSFGPGIRTAAIRRRDWLMMRMARE
jgi:hypothetical protein